MCPPQPFPLCCALCALRTTPKAVRLLHGRQVPRNQDMNLNAYMCTTTSKDNLFPLLHSSCLRQTLFVLTPSIFLGHRNATFYDKFPASQRSRSGLPTPPSVQPSYHSPRSLAKCLLHWPPVHQTAPLTPRARLLHSLLRLLLFTSNFLNSIRTRQRFRLPQD